MNTTIQQMAENGKNAGIVLSDMSTQAKNNALEAIAVSLLADTEQIIKANQADLEAGRKNQLADAMLDRLRLDEKRINAMAHGVREIIDLPDPVGELMDEWDRPNGLTIRKVRVPIGLIGIIFESRPNVTVDAASLCLKSGNACILRGGKEALESNKCLADCLQKGLKNAGLPETAIQLVGKTDRALVDELLSQDQTIDLIIPRGGKGLIERVVSKSRIPVIKHYDGICHTYVDPSADMNMAVQVCLNAKAQRPGVCNAMETLLVHQDAAAEFLPAVSAKLREAGVEIRGCEKTCALVSNAVPATEEDWSTEYLELILSVKVVASLEEAVEHITKYGSRHSDAIMASAPDAIDQFSRKVDSSAVFVNCSERFNDGFEFGFGAEIGISTEKLHARGPMGLRELCSYKYIVTGNGQIRT